MWSLPSLLRIAFDNLRKMACAAPAAGTKLEIQAVQPRLGCCKLWSSWASSWGRVWWLHKDKNNSLNCCNSHTFRIMAFWKAQFFWQIRDTKNHKHSFLFLIQLGRSETDIRCSLWWPLSCWLEVKHHNISTDVLQEQEEEDDHMVFTPFCRGLSGCSDHSCLGTGDLWTLRPDKLCGYFLFLF